MRRKAIIATFLAGTLAACSSTAHKVPQATTGSKADGTIRLGYDQGARENVIADWLTAERNALKRCQAWGYSRAEEFAGHTRQCTEIGQGLLVNGAYPGVCARYIVYKDYQCVD